MGAGDGAVSGPSAEIDRTTVDEARAGSVLATNSHMNFIKRILDPELYPVIWNEDGSFSTHRMAWSEVDGAGIVYPTIVQEGGDLVELGSDEALDFAIRSGEFIRFDDPAEAEWFSRNYKAAAPRLGIK